MRTLTLLIAGLLPLVSQAQTISTSSRFYIGVGGNLLTNVPFVDQGTAPRLVGPMLTAGLPLTSRLAVQAGLSYHWQKESFGSLFYTGTGAVISTATVRSKYFLVPVLLRYTITEPAAHFHFDALGGVTWLHATANVVYEATSGTNPYYEDNPSNSKVNVTLGPALRYTVSPHVELTANSLVSAALGKYYYQFSDRFFLNVGLGAHYTFGQR